MYRPLIGPFRALELGYGYEKSLRDISIAKAFASFSILDVLQHRLHYCETTLFSSPASSRLCE